LTPPGSVPTAAAAYIPVTLHAAGSTTAAPHVPALVLAYN
jgi:hypothetical protein